VETSDGLPFIGETSANQFVATGFAGNGMTFGTIAGLMARDAALDRPNPWAGLFDVGRTKIKGGAWDYLKENFDYPYYLIKDRLAGPEAKSLRALRRGQGKILELDGKRVAACRHDDGRVTLLSPICTHLGCQVDWNEAERTWDCPCHGSRFTPNGDVLSGPAEAPLVPGTVDVMVTKPDGSSVTLAAGFTYKAATLELSKADVGAGEIAGRHVERSA